MALLNGQLLQGNEATQVAHFSTTHSQKGAPKKGEKPPPYQLTPEMKKAFDQMKALVAAMYYMHTLVTTSLSTSSLMHLITNLVHASRKKPSQLHIIVRCLIVHTLIT
jgi:hypothetical protein